LEFGIYLEFGACVLFFFAIKCTRFIIKILDDAGVSGSDAIVGFCYAEKGGEPGEKSMRSY